ncbi:MAG TPA: hypothetical protein VE262_12310 [Blastocatellia bacterium]|nr:hypothetical protein [Blastocatellia bacterium]
MLKLKQLFVALLLGLATQQAVLAQERAPSAPLQTPEPSASEGAKDDAIGLAPARFELAMVPGTERTVIVNIIYSSASGEAEPCRLVASTGDWSILNGGDVEYYKAGTRPGSAAPWMIYTPGEVTVAPGKVHPIRVTISVPKDAAPGDHLAALFVESRPDNIKLDQNRRQVILRFRMAALFYIMVPQITQKGSLEGLSAEAGEGGIIVTPSLRNSGNSHIRPAHAIRVLNGENSVVADMPESESLPVLGNSELRRPLLIEKALPPGLYTVQYRVNFKDGGPIVEGQTELRVSGGGGQGQPPPHF